MPIFTKVDDFCHDFCSSNKCIAFDYGTHKIGVATGNFNDKIAFPKKVLFGNWSKLPDVKHVLLNEITQEQSEIIVIGLPKNLDGNENEKCLFIRNLADELLKNNNAFNIFLIDERFTTKATKSWQNFEFKKKKQKLCNRIRHKQEKNADDASSASILLDMFFNIMTNFSKK